MDKLKRITYDVGDNSPAPEADQFLVSLTAKGQAGSIYHIAESRQVKTKDGSRRYALGVYKADDLRPHTVVQDGHITVKGEAAHKLVWYARGPERPRFHPAEVSERQVFGDFLGQKTSGALCLLVLLDGQLYRYGQWAGLSGIQHVLGWCKFVDEDSFADTWESARPTWYLPTAEAMGYKVPASGATAQDIVTAFQSQVQHQAAVLYYYSPEWQFKGWMCYRKEFLSWAQALNEDAPHQVQALWHNHQVEAHGLDPRPYGFSPATYVEVIGRIQTEQNEAIRRESQNMSHSLETREYLKKMLRN